MNQKLKSYIREGANFGAACGLALSSTLGALYWFSYHGSLTTDALNLENGLKYAATIMGCVITGFSVGSLGGVIGYGYDSLESKIFDLSDNKTETKE